MRRAFTIIELVVVILILGILASIAAPRFFNASTQSNDNCIRQTLAVVRDAIDLHLASTGRLPGENGSEATFKADLAPYLRRLPALPVGPAQNATVAMDDKLTPVKGDNNPSEGWRYYYKTGTFIVNWKQPLASDGSIEYDDL
jgi:general secretion pathway protein G